MQCAAWNMLMSMESKPEWSLVQLGVLSLSTPAAMACSRNTSRCYGCLPGFGPRWKMPRRSAEAEAGPLPDRPSSVLRQPSFASIALARSHVAHPWPLVAVPRTCRLTI